MILVFPEKHWNTFGEAQRHLLRGNSMVNFGPRAARAVAFSWSRGRSCGVTNSLRAFGNWFDSCRQGGGEAKASLSVAEAGDPVLAPAIGSQVGVLEREMLPGFAVGRVVFAHGAPLAFREVGAPAFPVFFAVPVFDQTLLFERHVEGGKARSGQSGESDP